MKWLAIYRDKLTGQITVARFKEKKEARALVDLCGKSGYVARIKYEKEYS